MRVRGKFALIQSIIFLGFLVSLSFVILRFIQGWDLKQLELQGIESLTELRTFEQETGLFASRIEAPEDLWSEWLTTYFRFERIYTDMLESSSHRLLGRETVARRNSRLDAWRRLEEAGITPLIAYFESQLETGLTDLIGDRGILASRDILAVSDGAESPDVIRLTDLADHFSGVQRSLLGNVLIPTEVFIDDLRVRVDRYSSTLFITALAVALLIQAGGGIVAFRFSRRFSHHIIELEQTMARVANGNFDIDLQVHTGDELEQISRHFNLLTQDLWIRLESMKDMMRDIGSSTSEETDLGELRDFMLELAIDNTGADAGFLMGIDEGALALTNIQGYFPPPMTLPARVDLKREYIIDWFRSLRIQPGEGILGRILETGEPVFIKKNTGRELPENGNMENDLYINSAIFVPLQVSDETTGLLGLALLQTGSVFTDLDFSYMRSYAEFIAMTLDNMQKYFALLQSHQLNREIEVAADIQKTLLPEKLPTVPGAQVGAYSIAAKGVGGDYYDVFPLGGGKTAVVICDVAGKGVPASLLMVMIRTVVRTISSPEKRSDQILAELNKAITGRLGADRFATMSILVYDPRRGSVSYANGAHHPLYILRGESRRFHLFDADGLPIGIDTNASFAHKQIRVHAGDYLVLFTDGLPEARNAEGEEFGTDRLLRFVSRHAESSPTDLTRQLKDYLGDYSRDTPQHDDQTFIAMKIGSVKKT